MSLHAEEIFRTLGDRTRLRMIVLLRTLELTVGEMAQVLGQSQPRMSQHIKLLLEAGLITRRKEGNSVFLGLGSQTRVQPIFAALDSWAQAEGDAPWFEADRARLRAIRSDRSAEAQRFFEKNASRWQELNASHAPDSDIEKAILRALGDRKIGRLLDVGTGTGRMIKLLAPLADAALGVDRSPEMLRFARENLTDSDVRADLRQADMYALPFEDGSFDTVIMHQVLHYAQHPEAALSEAARMLAPGGALIVVDVAPHEREDFRRRFAHARLGFSDELVLKWLCDANLESRVADRIDGELTITVWIGRPAPGNSRKARRESAHAR